MTALIAIDKLMFWLGLGAAQKGAGSKPIKRRNWVVSLVVGVLVAAMMIVGMFLLLVSQKL
jgi:hypothetical protein